MNPTNPVVVAYKIMRPEVGGEKGYCAGTTADEVARAVRAEIESDEGLSADERSTLVIRPYKTTQDAIDRFPEFRGW